LRDDRRVADADELFFMAHDLGGAGHWADTIDVQWGRVLDASRDLGRHAAQQVAAQADD
jgi:hypothetical protein